MTAAPRIYVIYNPNAGQYGKKLFHQVLDILKDAGATVEIVQTEYAGHGRILAQEISQGNSHDIICAAGGDGTINEVLNGLYPASLPFAVIPLGTANILAKEIFSGETAEIIAHTILGGHQKDCWLGKADDQYFSLMVSMGPDSQAVNQVSLPLKKYLGKTAYLLSFLKQVLFSPLASYEIVIEGKCYQASSVIISKSKYYGGKYLCAPQADIGKQELHILLFSKKGRWAALIYALKMIWNRIPADKSVKIVTGHQVTVTADKEIPYQIDGDKGRALPVTIRLSSVPVSIIYDHHNP